VLKQLQYVPMSVQDQVMVLFAAINGYVDDVPVAEVIDFEARLLQFLATHHPEIGAEITKTRALSDDLETKLKAALDTFKKSFGS